MIENDFNINGFYRGVVVDNNDPLKAGRIKVRVMPFYVNVSDNDLPWALYADPFMGGYANAGGAFIPEINSVVYVFFDNGSFMNPIYFAGCPAIQNNIPDLPTSSRQADSIVTDINTKRQTNINDAFGGTWSEPVSGHSNNVYPKNKVLKTKNNVMVEMDDTTGNIRLHLYHPSGTREEVDNNGDIVNHCEGDEFTIVIGNQKILVKLASQETVNGNKGIKVGQNLKIVVGGNTDIITTGNTIITSTGNTTVNSVNTTVNSSGDTVVDSGGNTSITSGGNTDVVTSQASITASGSVTVTSSGTITLSGSAISLN